MMMHVGIFLFLDGVEWAGPDIAINHTQGTQGEDKGLVLERGRIGRSTQITPA
jgi:hypothetical protein